jgi:hypothetical protein
MLTPFMIGRGGRLGSPISWVLSGAALTLVLVALSAGVARANGYCGADPSGPTACGITTNETLSGVMTTPTYSTDYYVFFARKGTQVSITMDDTENPLCSVAVQYEFCGGVAATLYDGRGNTVASGEDSSPNGGVPVPETLHHTLRQGVYYVTVENLSDQGRPQPYNLSVYGSPALTWPHPCVVPRVDRHEHLGTARLALRNGSCTVGRLRRVRDRRVPAGDVVAFRPGVGTIARPGARVEVVVSGRPRQRG